MVTWTPPGSASWISHIGADAVRTVRNVRLGLITLNVLVMATCAVMLWELWRADVRMAETRAINAVRLTEQSATAILDKATIVLEVAAEQVESQMQGPRVQPAQVSRLAANHKAQIPELLRITIFDTQGTRVCPTTEPACKAANISDRDYFASMSQHPDDSIQLHGPYISRVDSRPILLLARSLRSHDGLFAGIIMGVVPLTSLQTLVATPNLGPHGSVSIRTAHLDLLVRQPPIPPEAALSPHRMVSPELVTSVALNPSEGVFRARAAMDDVDRVMAYRRVPRYPLYIQTGVAADDFLASWRIQLAWTLGFLTLFAAASWLVAHITAVSLRRQAMAQKLYHEAPCGYHTLDEQGHYLSINATELKWLGCEEKDVIRQLKPTDFFTDEGKANFALTFPQLKQVGHLQGIEVDLVGRHGEIRRVQINAKVMVDEQTGFWMSNSVMHDITALHQARQQLEALTKEQGVMLDTDLVGIFKVQNRCVIWANHGAERLFGYTANEWRNMPTRQLYDDEETYHRIGQECFAALDAGKPYRTQLQMVRKNGLPAWIDVNAVYLSAQTNEVMLIAADITPIKLMEESRVRAVELDAQNAQLRETSRLQNEFLSNMSHELRTPLNAIIGFAQLLTAGLLKPDAPKYATCIQQIGSSGEHLLRLIETMLDYALVEAGKMVFSPTPTPLRQALQEVMDLCQPHSARKNLNLALDVSPDLQQVIADPVRLKQMLQSLLDNAIKFSQPGGQITVRAQVVDDDFWSMQVEDHGIGIAKADLPKLFAPFVQLSSGASKSHGGTGLGLTLLRRLVLAQGGQVDVRSELGQGTVFTLTLPRVLKTAGQSHRSPALA
ncbi:MAG: PAS domain-containing protein [Burkholderiales bacterium]|nr:PAS domain-containing protein [Burkholderiales bacterium]